MGTESKKSSGWTLQNVLFVIAAMIIVGAAIQTFLQHSSAISNNPDGGLNLEKTCSNQGEVLFLTEYSAAGWRCKDGETILPINLSVACEDTYGIVYRNVMISDPYNPNSITCKKAVTSDGIQVNNLPAIGSARLDSYCQYGVGLVNGRYRTVEHQPTCYDEKGNTVNINLDRICLFSYPFRNDLKWDLTEADDPGTVYCHTMSG